MKLTRIHQIEITSRCNLACKYCPHPKLERVKMDMCNENLYRSMQWVKYFSSNGTQPELAITGMGEALLHSNFFSMMEFIRSQYKGFLHFSTNGILFTEDVAKFCSRFNVGVFVSMHRPEIAGPAIELARKHGVLVGHNSSFVDSSLDFAGQVDWPNTAPSNLVCAYQRDAWGMVLADGRINTCCWEAEGKNVIGHVDDEIGSVSMKVMPACSNCSLIIEEGEPLKRENVA